MSLDFENKVLKFLKLFIVLVSALKHILKYFYLFNKNYYSYLSITYK